MKRRSRIACWLVLALLVPSIAAAAPCTCGKQRWSVKTGSDPNAGNVDLTHEVATTIAELAGLEKPESLPSNARIAPTELTVFKLTATLALAKREKDCDYHIVLCNDSGDSLVAEIPIKTCVKTSSPFRGAIGSVRQQFEAHYGNIGSSWKTINETVEIVGVGYFDHVHGQKGSASNGIELHPVLRIDFNPAPVVAASIVGGQELLVNGGFEETPSSGMTAPGWVMTSNVSEANYITTGGNYPHGGAKYAFMGVKNDSEGTLAQTAAIPQAASAVVLQFWASIVTSEEEDAEPYDFLSVEIENSAGGLLATKLVLSNDDAFAGGNAPAGYVHSRAIDLSEFAGSTVRIVFRARCDESNRTTFRIDDVSLRSAP